MIPFATIIYAFDSRKRSGNLRADSSAWNLWQLGYPDQGSRARRGRPWRSQRRLGASLLSRLCVVVPDGRSTCCGGKSAAQRAVGSEGHGDRRAHKDFPSGSVSVARSTQRLAFRIGRGRSDSRELHRWASTIAGETGSQGGRSYLCLPSSPKRSRPPACHADALGAVETGLAVSAADGSGLLRRRPPPPRKPRLLLATSGGAVDAAEALFDKCPVNRARAGLTLLRAARGDEPRAPVARSGQARRSARPPRPGLRLVHRRLRHARPDRREGAAGGAAVEEGRSGGAWPDHAAFAFVLLTLPSCWTPSMKPMPTRTSGRRCAPLEPIATAPSPSTCC